MSLIPFILDLADELHEYNRCLTTIGGGSGAGASGMDVDDFGFGIYPHELQPPTQQPLQQQQQRESQRESLLRRPRTYSTQLYWLPSVKQQRIHPYSRNKVCCASKFTSVGVGEADTPIPTARESGTSIGTNTVGATTAAAAASVAVQDGVSTTGAAGATKSSYSVVNKNGFQVSMNVKQFAANELTVKTIDNCIVVEGQHEDKEDGHGVISRHFIRKYMLPKGYDPAEVLSTLSSDGILTVKAPPPSPPKTDKPMERIVDIEQTGPTHSNTKEHVKSTAATPPVAVSQQTKQPQPQPQPQQQLLNEHNTTNANNNNNNNIHDAPTDMEVSISPPIIVVSAVSTTADDAVPEKTTELPMLVANNIGAVVSVADDDAIMSATADGKANDKVNVNVSVSVNDSDEKLMEKNDDNSGNNSNGNDENTNAHIGSNIGKSTETDAGIVIGIGNNTANITSNNISASSADDVAVAPVEEHNGGIAVIPITAAAAEIPGCNEVVVVMETDTNADATNLSIALTVAEETDITITDVEATPVSVEVKHETTDGNADGDVCAATIIEAEQVLVTKAPVNVANNDGETVTVTENTADAANAANAAPTLTSTTANLVAAADAAILLAKAHNRSVAVAEENGNKVVAIAEELAN